MKLDIGCGPSKKEGHVGVDINKWPCVDVVHDLTQFPWPFDDSSVEEVYSRFLFEHISTEYWGPLIKEVHRVLIPKGVCTIVVPALQCYKMWTPSHVFAAGGEFFYREQFKPRESVWWAGDDWPGDYFALYDLGYEYDPELIEKSRKAFPQLDDDLIGRLFWSVRENMVVTLISKKEQQ